MGIDVEILDEFGTLKEEFGDPKGLVAGLVMRAEPVGLIGQIDPYGHTVFNPLQARILRDEWARLAADESVEEFRAAAERVMHMIDHVASGAHRYLRFRGD